MADNQLTAFVAGATGHTGREVVRILCEKGLKVHAHVRPDSPRLAEWKERFAKMGAQANDTAWEPSAMARAMAEVRPDLVFALIGTTHARRRKAESQGADASKESYESVDFGLTAMLVKACVSSGHHPRFIYLSAMGTSEKARGAYGRARWKAEEAVRASGLTFVIARPAFITGEGRDEPRPLESVGASLIEGALSLADALGLHRFPLRYGSITNTDLAAALVRAALEMSMANQVLEAEDLRKKITKNNRTEYL